MVNINVGGAPESVDFYSPSTHAGLSITGANRLAFQNPNWSTKPIPSDFLSLAAALSRVPGHPAPGDLDHAYLYRLGSDSADPIDLMWLITLKAANADTVAVPAYVMPKEVFERLLNAANRNDVQAEYTLGRVYGSGVAGTPDRQKSAQWIAKAAQQGHAAAANALGQYCEFAIGIPRNMNAAVYWYRKAANTGFAPGEYNLGLMYERGLGVPRDFIAARAWITKAARQGLPSAQSELPLVNVAANGQVRKFEAMKARQARSSQCPLGTMRTPWGCTQNGAIFAEYRMRTGKNI